MVIFSIVYNLLLTVLQLWFVLTVPEDFKLFNWIYSSWNLQNIWLWAFRQHSFNYRCRLVPQYPFHMEEIKCCKHVRGTLLLKCLICFTGVARSSTSLRRDKNTHLCWKQLKVSCHNNRDMCSLLTMSGML